MKWYTCILIYMLYIYSIYYLGYICIVYTCMKSTTNKSQYIVIYTKYQWGLLIMEVTRVRSGTRSYLLPVDILFKQHPSCFTRAHPCPSLPPHLLPSSRLNYPLQPCSSFSVLSVLEKSWIPSAFVLIPYERFEFAIVSTCNSLPRCLSNISMVFFFSSIKSA